MYAVAQYLKFKFSTPVLNLVLEYYSTHLSDFALVNRPNNCHFVGQSRTKRPTFPRPREFRVIW